MKEDIALFEEWMDLYAHQIERFAFQYGYSSEKAAQLTVETFRAIYNNEEKMVEGKLSIYKIALDQLVHAQQSDSEEETILPFEEDQQLHEKINALEEKAKVSLILSRFHNMSEAEIATILEISEEAVREAIRQAIQQLIIEIDNSHLDKRLEFLQKSYERISSSFRKDQVFAPRKEEVSERDIKKQPISKKALISWVAGILTLAALVIIPVFTDEERQKIAAEKYIEQLKTSFEEEIGNRYAQLGLKESTEEDQQNYYYFTEYGKQAREDFETMLQEEEKNIVENGKINKKTINNKYAAIIKSIELPSEMVEQLIKHPLTDDKDKSMEFISNYVKQIFSIQQSYVASIYQHQQLIEEAMSEGQFQIEKFLEKKETYPEELQNALNSMEKQNLYIDSVSEWAALVPSFARNELSGRIKASIHEDLAGYLALLESSSYISQPKLVSTYEESIGNLLEIERTLLAGPDIQLEIPYLSLRDYYSRLFYVLITDSETNRIFGSDGKIKEEIRSAWKKIASGGKGSPSAHVMRNIIREMEASGWANSEMQSRFTYYHLNYAMGLAKAGNLHSFVMTGILQTDQGFDIVTFPDLSFEELVEETYNLYSSNHDPAVLKDAHPFVIFAMYYFANAIGDPVTMWHLYKPEDNPQSLEDYLVDWQQEDFQLNELDGLLFEERESSVGSIVLQKGNHGYYAVDMIADEPASWKISSINLDMLEHE
ncbi:RNA polymerase sigma factor [Sporosarcina beigongshangi]|uniref:RNA polymerase sigma factor n=1 Tax=Sporosarcina beigongshangi TaxID=2782538 RepID=UPI001939A9A3|nr:sigma-70 family RNA polymerase sigma factor [Sporosarcina beigongshangi]